MRRSVYFGRYWLAPIQTAHWTFEVVAFTKGSARKRLRAAWLEHQRQTGAELTFAELLEDGSVYFDARVTGTVYRDGSPMRLDEGEGLK